MKLSVKKTGGEFTPHPETDGTVNAVIVDVTPLKTRMTEYGEKEEFRLVYETEVLNENGVRHCVWSRGYSCSLHPKSAFRKELKKILGRDITEAENDEFDTECLLGLNVKLIIQHEVSGEKTYANISFLGSNRDGGMTPSGKYTRVKDRPEKDDNASGGASQYRKAAAPADEDDGGRVAWQKTKVHVGKHAGVDLGDLPEDAVKALIEKWLPTHEANPKPKADDKRLAAALVEVRGLMPQPAADEEF